MSTRLKAAGILASAAIALTVAAQTNSPAPSATGSATSPPEASRAEKMIKGIKNPVPWFSWGGDLRGRNEYFNNAVTLNNGAVRHEQDYFRYRERIWASVMPATNVSVNVRFSGEQREWMKPSYAGQYVGREGMEYRYGILDNAYVKWSNIADVPLTLSAGRQDVQFGDPLNWWLVGDGTPADGSWTGFIDSARLGFDAAEIKTKFDLVYLYQSARPDAWIPTLGESGDKAAPYYLTEQNEQGVILYASNKSVKHTQIDGYFIYKHDDKELANGDNADIYTVGSKISGTPTPNWAYSIEGAYQFGSKQDPMVGAAYVTTPNSWRTIDAWGANGKLTYLFKDDYDNQVSLIGEYLSGDDPRTKGTDEMFDVLWGRWPRWSELYIYSYIYETGRKIAQMNNILRFGPNWTCTPVKNTTFSATYNALFAPVDVPTRAVAPTSFGDGNFRGHYLQTVLKHKFNDHVSAHLWAEFVWMGNYYTQKDLMTFLRAEVLYTF
jgi:hypothetical protein